MIFGQDGEFIEKEVRYILKTYYLSTGINISVVDENGKTKYFEGIPNTFCGLYNKMACRHCECDKNHLNACRQSLNLGEPYFFFCELDFIHIVIPLINQGKFVGGVVVGPIIIKTKDVDFNTEELLDQFKDSPEYDALQKAFNNLQTTDPVRVNYLGNMLYMLISNEIDSYNDTMSARRKKMYLQAKINEEIQQQKKSDSDQGQIHLLENKLFSKVRSANVSEAKALLNELLSRIVYEEGQQIQILRTRAIEICSLLSRAAIDGGADERKMLSFNYTLFSDLNKLKTLSDVSYWLSRVLDYYLDNIIVITHGYNSDIIKKALTYINNHYKEGININQVASYVHLNPSYFSTLFKKETGQTFSEYLLKNRIEESKLLLANTDMEILDISISVGLNSQSYFTKVFKKQTAMTPSRYRKENSVLNYKDDRMSELA